MTAASATTTTVASATRPAHYGSMSNDRKWALRWSYFFLILFAIFFLTPPIYMLITSLKTSQEISAITNPWWVYNATLEMGVDRQVTTFTQSEFGRTLQPTSGSVRP